MHPLIPERADHRQRRGHRPRRKPYFDREAYRRRNAVEQAADEAPAIANRFLKLATQHHAAVILGVLELYLRLSLASTP